MNSTDPSGPRQPLTSPTGVTEPIEPADRPSGSRRASAAARAMAPEVIEAVDRARRAQGAWGALSPRQRARYLRRARQLLVERMDTVAATVREETGKPRIEALAHEVLNVLNLIRVTERAAPRMLRRRRVGTGLLLSKSAYKQYEPLGVIGVISPWNFPFMLPALPLVQALAAGNGVVLKPSEIAPRSGRLLVDLFREALADFPDLVQVVEGDGAVGAALVQAGVDKIAFIGGGPTGKRVLQGAAEMLTPVVLELGGNDAAIICEDADLPRAARGVVWGALANAGQCCVGIERALVCAGVHDRFVALVREEFGRVRVGTGDDADVSRLTFPRHRETLDRLVADAEQRGAEVVRLPLPPGTPEEVYPPTLILRATTDMELNRTEAFGPLLSVLQVRSEDEAIALNNDGLFGLSPSVWTRSRTRARRMADRLHAGFITINDHLIGFAFPGLPYGGVKESGFGRLMGDEGLLEFVRVKSVTGARLTLSREPHWFPYRPRDVAGLRALLRVWFRPGVVGRIHALFGR
jgi:acyl-CoA reductase-like NAD-dependent aldehyde dehydrogenase